MSSAASSSSSEGCPIRQNGLRLIARSFSDLDIGSEATEADYVALYWSEDSIAVSDETSDVSGPSEEPSIPRCASRDSFIDITSASFDFPSPLEGPSPQNDGDPHPTPVSLPGGRRSSEGAGGAGSEPGVSPLQRHAPESPAAPGEGSPALWFLSPEQQPPTPTPPAPLLPLWLKAGDAPAPGASKSPGCPGPFTPDARRQTMFCKETPTANGTGSGSARQPGRHWSLLPDASPRLWGESPRRPNPLCNPSPRSADHSELPHEPSDGTPLPFFLRPGEDQAGYSPSSPITSILKSLGSGRRANKQIGIMTPHPPESSAGGQSAAAEHSPEAVNGNGHAHFDTERQESLHQTSETKALSRRRSSARQSGARRQSQAYLYHPSLDPEDNGRGDWKLIAPSQFTLPFAQYLLGPTIGKGSFGKVKVAMHRLTGQKVAVKMMRKDLLMEKGMEFKVQRELRVLRTLRHPQLIKLFQVIETPTDIFMVMEYVNGGELLQYTLKNWPLQKHTVRFLFQQLVLGVGYLHSHWCIHRDLKPENVLLDSKLNLKIADFGLSTSFVDGGFLQTSCGTPCYAAPEVLSGKLYGGPEVDVWSCGVILYTMECGRLPFEEHDGRELLRRVCTGQYAIPWWVNRTAADVIQQMMCVDPVQRITLAQLKQHRFFCQKLPQYLCDERSRSEMAQTCPSIDQRVLQYACAKLGVPLDEGRRELLNGTHGAVWACYCILERASQRLHPRDFGRVAQPPMKEDKGVKPSSLRPAPLMEGLYVEDRGVSTRLSYSRCAQEQASPFQLARLHLNPFKGRDRLQLQMKRLVRYDLANSWRLGIFTEYSTTYIFSRVYIALKELLMVWKIVAPFHLHCRTTTALVPPAVSGGPAPRRAWSLPFFERKGSASSDGRQASDPAIGPEVPRHVPATVGLQLFRVARYGYLLDCYCAGDADVLVGLEVASLLYHRLRAQLSLHR